MSLDEEVSEFTPKSTFDHPYPTTKIMWIPDSVCIIHIKLCILFIFIDKFYPKLCLHYRKEYFPIC